jgi:N-acetylglucosamine kinase-like BadF-type ATPase
MGRIKLIADGGGTKTEWRLMESSSKKSFFTTGISPYYLSKAEIEQLLLKEFPSGVLKKQVDEIFYYGTGCKTKEKANLVAKALAAIFPKAKIQVTHDLMGAAIATCGNQPGIVCILGTGSNSCVYNGKRMVSNSPGLGFILGDEGSGAYLGKKVVQHFLYGVFDEALQSSFLKEFKTSKEEILHKVYKEPFANRYLAGFAKFLSMHRGHYMVENIIEDGLRDFFDQHLQHYPKNKNYTFHFVGGVAYHFRDKIAELCRDYGFRLGKIMQQPMKGIVQYHCK